jgi:WD40 repeat protein/serine/threonine protein kinase/DNA-binding XRE family transcriptional regulator
VEETNYSFGYYIQRRRKAMDLTRAELAARVQCSHETIKKIERDERKPSRQIAELIADALILPADERNLFFQVLHGERMVSDLDLPLQPVGSPGRVVRGYTFQEQIGQGSFGAVYRAWQPSVGREVAIKVILPKYTNRSDFIRRFEAEARTIAHLEHPHITPLYDFWRDPHGAFLVMRWMRGGNLRSRLGQDGPVSFEYAVRWINQLSRGLAAAHGKGVVHGDLKPENMLFDEDGNIYLSDFGIARRIESSSQFSPSPYSISPIYSSPEHLQSEPLSPQSDLYCLGILLYEMLAGKPPFMRRSPESDIRRLPLLRSFRDDLPPKMDDFIQRALAWDPQERFPDALTMVAALDALTAGRTLLPAAPGRIHHPPANPYKGLRAFEEADASDFFGRNGLIKILIDRLGVKRTGHTQETPAQGRFLAVVGPSGSGKSSVVKAGLLPALRQGRLPGAEKWFIVEMTPGGHPLEELEAALLRVAVNPPASLLDQLTEDKRGLLRAVKRVLPDDKQVELLLFIDQFEELFTLVEEPGLRQDFLDRLLTAVSALDSRLRVVVTLRADFYDRPLLYQGFADLMRLYTEVVLPLTPEELVESIRRPAQRAGVNFEEDLVPAIASDVVTQPGALPLMQYALTELFECQEDGILTHTAYRETGGVLGALSRRAEELYSSLEPSHQEIARQLFLRLVTLGEGVEDTRRRAKLSELIGLLPRSTGQSAADPSGQAQPLRFVVETFGKARLLSFDLDTQSRSPTVEIAHEAMLYEWKRLKLWLDEARNEVRLQRALNRAASDWHSANRDPSFLLYGTRLDQFDSWALETSLALNSQEKEYLNSSLAALEERNKKEQERRRREASLIRRSRKFLYSLVIVLLLGILASFGMAGRARQAQFFAEGEALARATQQALAEAREEARATQQALAVSQSAARALAEADALSQKEAAQKQADLAFARELSLASNLVLNQDPELSMMLALQSLETEYTNTGEEALRSALHASRVKFAVDVQKGLSSLDYNPNGAQIATVDFDGLLTIWDGQTGEELLSWQLEDIEADILAYAPNSERLAVGLANGDILILDARTGETRLQMPGHSSWFVAMAFSLDGNLLASANNDGTIRIWDSDTGESMFMLDAPTGGWSLGNILAFIPGSNYLMVTDYQNNHRIIDLETGLVAVSLPPELFGGHIAVSPDGAWLATGGEEFKVRVWDLPSLIEVRSDQPRFILQGHSNAIHNFNFSPDSRLLASASFDSTIKIWEISRDSARELMTLSGHKGPVNAAKFSPDGASLATVSRDGKLLVWDVSTVGSREVLTLAFQETNVRKLALSPDGNFLAAASEDGMVRVIDFPNGRLRHTFIGHQGMVHAVAFSPDSGRLVSAGEDFTLRIWDVDTGRELMLLTGHEDAWGQKGDYRVGASFAGVLSVAYSPDGKLIASTGEDSTLRLWDAETGDRLMVLPIHPLRHGGTNLAFSPDGSRLATSTDLTGPDTSGGGVLAIIWDTTNGEALITIDDLPSRVWGLAFSPDGSQLALGGFGGFITVRDVISGNELFSLSGHTSTVVALAFSPDGTRLVSSGAELPKIWVLETRQALFSLPGHEAIVTSVIFNSDGTRLAAAGGDGTVRIYTTDLEELKTIAADRLTRWFTPEECQQYLHIDKCPPKP